MMLDTTHVKQEIISEQLRHRQLSKSLNPRPVAVLNQAPVEALQVIILLILMAKEASLISVCIVT